MGVLIDNRPRRARAGAARKRAAPSPWLSAGGQKGRPIQLTAVTERAATPHSWGGAPFMNTPPVGGLNSRNKPFVGLATRGFVPHSLDLAAPVEPKRSERDRDDATLGLPAAFPPPPLEVAARGVYASGAIAAASGLGTPGPSCPFRPTPRVTGNLIQGRETRQSHPKLHRASLGNGRLPPRRKEAPFCKRSDQNGASFPEEEGTALGAPRGVSLDYA